MFDKKIITVSVILLLIVSFSCKKDSTSLPDFKILVYPAVTEARLILSLSEPDTTISYSVYNNNVLICQNLKAHEFVIKNLAENTRYSGKVVATDRENNSSETTFSFITLINQAPSGFEFVTNFITGDSVSFTWSKSLDPEGGPVSYDILLNNVVIASDQQFLGFTIGNLTPQTHYRIDVSAKDTLHKTTVISMDFKTLKSGTRLVHKLMTCENYLREFGFFVPSGISNKNVPLVIFLHGAGGVAWPELTGSYFSTIAEREKFIFAMPQALLGTTTGGTYIQWNAHEVLAWDDVSFIHSMIDSLALQYRIDASRIYVCGMSNGGFMTFYLASRSNRFAAIAPMSGLITYNIYGNYQVNRPMPLLYIHNTADPIVKYDGEAGIYPSAEEVIRRWAKANGCDTIPVETQLPDISTADHSTVTLFDYNGNNPKSEIRFYRINGGSHSIPGIETSANQDINAFEEIWAFFRKFSKSK